MRILNVEESQRLLAKYKLPLAKSVLCKSEKQALAAAAKIGFPIVMKIASPQIVHKTEAKGVQVNIRTEKDVAKVFHQLQENAHKYDKKAKIDGVVVQEMVKGVELLVGSKRDAQFGSVLVIGAGGTLVEVMKDTTLRVVPVTREDILAMLAEIKAQSLLTGFRGQPAVDKEALIAFLLKVSQMLIAEHPAEMDLNPVMVSGSEITIADVRIVK